MPKTKITGSETLYDFDWEWSMMNIEEIEIDYELTCVVPLFDAVAPGQC